MQNYLKPNRVLTYQDQIDIFSYRLEMNEVNKNVTGLKEDQTRIFFFLISWRENYKTITLAAWADVGLIPVNWMMKDQIYIYIDTLKLNHSDLS